MDLGEEITFRVIYSLKGQKAGTLNLVCHRLGMKPSQFIKRAVENELKRLGVDWES